VDAHNWVGVWLSGAAIAAVVTVAFGLLFPKETEPAAERLGQFEK